MTAPADCVTVDEGGALPLQHALATAEAEGRATVGVRAALSVGAAEEVELRVGGNREALVDGVPVGTWEMAEVPVLSKGLAVGETDSAGEAEAEGECVPDGVAEGETDASLLPVEEREESLLPDTAGVAVEVRVCAAAVAVASTVAEAVAGALPVRAVALELALCRDEAVLPRLALAGPEGVCPAVSRAEAVAVAVARSDAESRPVALAEALEAPPPKPPLRVA